MDTVKTATVWLGGCAGCHMSFLDIDEALLEVARRIRMVYSPVMDVKSYPEGVDVCLVEGAVANDDNMELIRTVRRNTRTLVALGDCAVTGNVPAMRNAIPAGVDAVLRRGYEELAQHGRGIPSSQDLPRLLPSVVPLHHVVRVDLFVPGCPPPSGRIAAVLTALLGGATPHMVGRDMLKFG